VPRSQDGGAQRLIGADARHACRDLGSGNPELPKRKRGGLLGEGNDFFISDLRHWICT
jgi:hypothetical protein